MSRDSDGLSLRYRIGYRLRWLGLTFFGPAQQSEEKDPRARLRRERQARIEAAASRRPAEPNGIAG